MSDPGRAQSATGSARNAGPGTRKPTARGQAYLCGAHYRAEWQSGGSISAFVIDPAGTALLAGNEHANQLSGFNIDSIRGCPTPLGTLTKMPGPACLVFASLG